MFGPNECIFVIIGTDWSKWVRIDLNEYLFYCNINEFLEKTASDIVIPFFPIKIPPYMYVHFRSHIYCILKYCQSYICMQISALLLSAKSKLSGKICRSMFNSAINIEQYIVQFNV